jgi:hypothetical protein
MLWMIPIVVQDALGATPFLGAQESGHCSLHVLQQRRH